MKMKKLLAIFLSTVLLLSLFACGEINDSNPQKEQDKEECSVPDSPKEDQEEDKEKNDSEVKKTLSFTFSQAVFEHKIDISTYTPVYCMYEREDLEYFCDRYNIEETSYFMKKVAKYDDAYFENNTLVLYYYGDPGYNEIEVSSIEHVNSSDPYCYLTDSYIMTLTKKIYLGDRDGMMRDPCYECLLIEIEGKYNIADFNTLFNITSEFWYG